MRQAKLAVHVILIAVAVLLTSWVAVWAQGAAGHAQLAHEAAGHAQLNHEALELIEDQFLWLTGAAVTCGGVLCAAVLVLWKALNAERKYRAIQTDHDRQRIDRCLEAMRKRLEE